MIYEFELKDGATMLILEDGRIFVGRRLRDLTATDTGRPQEGSSPVGEKPVSAPSPNLFIAPHTSHIFKQGACVECGEVDPLPRRRGRPKKAPEAIAGQSGEVVEVKKDETLENCPYCNRVFPPAAIELHKENCGAAARGYWTHVATPGQRS